MYGEESLEQFDREAREQSEARVINISDETVRFEIAQQPGSKPRRYVLAPYGQQGDGIHLQIGYTRPYRGAGRGDVRPTIESITEREIIAEVPPTPLDPGRPGLRVPFVVHEEHAAEGRARYEQALAKAGKHAKHAPRVVATQAPRAAPFAQTPDPEPAIDEEAQDGPLDEPPPDDDLPPVIAPKRGGKG